MHPSILQTLKQMPCALADQLRSCMTHHSTCSFPIALVATARKMHDASQSSLQPQRQLTFSSAWPAASKMRRARVSFKSTVLS